MNVKLTLPVSNQEAEIKPWITGREAEYIDELTYEAMAVKADLAGNADIGNIDLKKIITESNHRKITTFVVTLTGSGENILDRALSLHENDYDYLLEAIDGQRKKKAASA